MVGADQLCSFRIGLRTLKPPQNLHNQVRVKIGIQSVHDRDVTCLESHIELRKYVHQMTGARGFIRNVNRDVETLMIENQDSLAVR